MCDTTENLTCCEVIRFLSRKNLRSIEIYQEFCTVYGNDAMSEAEVISGASYLKMASLNGSWLISSKSFLVIHYTDRT